MDYAGFLAGVEQGQIPPVALLHGPEARLLDDALSRLTRALFPDPALLPLNREVFDPRETEVEVVVRSALTLPSLARARLVVVKGVQALVERAAAPLASYLRDPNPSTCLLLLADETLPSGHWLLKALPAAAVVAVPRPTGRGVVAWLRGRAREEGAELSEAAAQLLIRWAGEDLATLSGELDKALLLRGPGHPGIGEEEIRQVVGEHRLRRSFELADAVGRRELGSALALLDRLLLAGEEPLALLGVLTRQVRATWQVVEWRRQGRSAEEIGRLLRRPAFAVEGLSAHARALSSRWLAGALARCWEVERRLKSGGEPRAELTVLVADLCRAG